MSREFLLQRYCADNWPQLRGERPWIVAGPRLMEWVVPGSLERSGSHILRHEIRLLLHGMLPSGGIHRHLYQHRAAGEIMLRERVVDALWINTHVSRDDSMWDMSISQVCRELPLWWSTFPGQTPVPISTAVSDYLAGIPTAAMIRDYISEDDLDLEVLVPPTC